MQKTSKYDCKKNLEILDFNIQKLYNLNLKFDYNKIYNIFCKKLENIELTLYSPTTKTFELYLLNYEIIQHIQKLNKIF